MRSMSTAGASQLGKRSALTLLVKMLLDTPVFIATSSIDIDYEGDTYIGGRGVSIEPVKDQGGEVQALQFTLSGVPSEYISMALATQIQGKRIVVYTALMDPDTHTLVDVMPMWSGTLDQMPIKHGPATSTISVTAEHRGIAFARPKALRYSDAEQRRAFSGDRCLEFLVAQSQHQDIWPSAAFFRT